MRRLRGLSWQPMPTAMTVCKSVASRAVSPVPTVFVKCVACGCKLSVFGHVWEDGSGDGWHVVCPRT